MLRAVFWSAQHDAGLAKQTECPANSNDRFSRLGRILQSGRMSQQLHFFGHAKKVPTDHLTRSQCCLLADPQADQRARDDGTLHLKLNTVLSVAQHVTVASRCLKKRKKISIVQ